MDIGLIGLRLAHCEIEGDVLRLPRSDGLESLAQCLRILFLTVAGVIHEDGHAVVVVFAAVGDVGHSRHLAALRQVARKLDTVDLQAVVTRIRGQRQRVARHIGVDIVGFHVLILQPFLGALQPADGM